MEKINTENYLKMKKYNERYERNRYQNMSKEKKQKLKEYQRNYLKEKN